MAVQRRVPSLPEARHLLEYVAERDVEVLLRAEAPPDCALQALSATATALSGAPQELSWEAARRELQCDLLGRVMAFQPQDRGDPARPGAESLSELLKPHVQQPDLHPQLVARSSRLAAALCDWCRALYVHCGGDRSLLAQPPKSSRPRGKDEEPPECASSEHAAVVEGGELAVRSMLTGDIVTTLKGFGSDWTAKDLTKAVMAAGTGRRGAKPQFFHADAPLDPYATLLSQGVVAGVVDVAFVSLFDLEGASQEEAERLTREARQALDVLRAADIREVKSFHMPPPAVLLVLEAVAVLLGEDTDWQSIKKMLSQATFLRRLVELDVASVPDATLVALQWYVDHEGFHREVVQRCSIACAGLCLWCRGVFATAVATLARDNLSKG